MAAPSSKTPSSISTLDGFLTACGAQPSEFKRFADITLRQRPDRFPRVERSVPKKTASTNPAVTVEYNGDTAIVRPCGPQLWAEVHFQKNEDGGYVARQINIGNSGLSGTSAYRADDKVLTSLAEVARSKPVENGVAAAELSRKLDGFSQYRASRMAAGYEKFSTLSPEGYNGALALIHGKLIERNLAVTDYQYKRPSAIAPTREPEKLTA